MTVHPFPPAPPSLDGKGRIVATPEGVIVPIPSDIDTVQPLETGVLDAAGRLVPESVTWRDGRPFSLPPRVPAEDEIETRSGRVMFGGLMFGHFGHFLVESTARLWAYQRLQDRIDAIAFVPKVQRRIDHVLDIYTPFLRLLGIEAPILNLPEPVRFDHVEVPQQGFGMFGMIEGLAEYRDFMRSRLGARIGDDGAKKLYVSRSALPRQRGGLLGEELIEQYLAAEGYEIFHPQLHDFETQLAAYRSADFIVSPDGSPLHMAALVVKPGTKVAVIARRPAVAAQFALQFRAFCGIETVTIDALKCHWIPENNARPSRLSYGELDFGQVHAQLLEGGLITGSTPWPDIAEADRDAILADLKERQKIGFKLYQGAA